MVLLANTSAFLEPVDYSNRTAAEKAYIDALIPVGQKYLEEFCSRKFEAATYTDEAYNGTGEKEIFVANPPINTLTDIDVITSFATSDTGTNTVETYDDANFSMDSEAGMIRWKPSCARSFPAGFQNILITYNGGFQTGSSDLDVLAHLNAQFVIEMFDPSEIVGTVEKEKLGDYFYAKSRGFAEKFISSNKRLLNYYKIRKILI